MSNEVFNILENLMADPAMTSWHESARRDLGIPEDCAEEALLCLRLMNTNTEQRPLAFVLNQRDLQNTMLAVMEYVRESLHPLYGHGVDMAVLDLMPPMDDLGAARGVARRWVVDKTNQALVMPAVHTFLKKFAQGL